MAPSNQPSVGILKRGSERAVCTGHCVIGQSDPNATDQKLLSELSRLPSASSRKWAECQTCRGVKVNLLSAGDLPGLGQQRSGLIDVPGMVAFWLS